MKLKKLIGVICLIAFTAFSTAFAAIGCASTGDGTGGTGAHTHVDGNNDGLCDKCRQSVEVVLDFFSVNDLHGKLGNTYYNTGVDEMSAYLENAAEKNPNTVILSAGDMWQGGPESNVTHGAIMTEWMNEMGFEAMAMGNHEYDWGKQYILQNAEIAQFPFLGINVYDSATNERVEYCEASVTVERSGVQIGVIGAIGDCYGSIAADKQDGYYFKVDDELTELVKAESQKLRSEGADVIIYLLHDSKDSNYDYYDTSLSDGYVDLVFEGHSHSEVCRADSEGVWHLQAGGDNRTGLSYAQIRVNTANGKSRVSAAKVIEHSAYSNLTPHPVVEQLFGKYEEQLQTVNEVLGTNATYKESGSLVQVAATALLNAGLERWGSDPAYAGKIVLGGGYLNVRSPYYLPAGPVTYGDITTLFPFDNHVVLCEVTGARLKSQFIYNSSYCSVYSDYGLQIVDNVNNAGTYYVVVDTYCANYNYNNMGYMSIIDYYDLENDYYTRSAVADYIRGGGIGLGQDELPDGGGDGVQIGEISSVSQLLQIGSALADNGETAIPYRIKGVVTGIDNLKYGNMYVQDATGELFIYGVYDTSGNRYDAMPQKPAVGSEVILEGVIKKYVDKDGGVTVEMVNATCLKIVGEDDEDGDPEGALYDKISDVLASAEAVVGAKVRGEVIAVSAESFLISDNTAIIMFYTKAKPDVSVGDKVEVVGDTTIYSGNQQFSSSTAQYTKKELSVSYDKPLPTRWTNKDVEGFNGAIGAYITIDVNIFLSNGYYNCEPLSNSSLRTVSLIAPSYEALNGLVIDETPVKACVVGYPCYLNGEGGKYVKILPESITLITEEELFSLELDSSFGGSNISGYDTGTYGEYYTGGVKFEYYRAYKPFGTGEYLFNLIPFVSAADDGSLPGSVYNITPIFGLTEVQITYKSSAPATLYTGLERAGQMQAHALPASQSYSTVSFAVDADNFFKLSTGDERLFVKALTFTYDGQTTAYNTVKANSGEGEYRLNATSHEGELVPGVSTVAVPVDVEYTSVGHTVLQTKEYTYYSLDYLKSNPDLVDEAAMLTPADVAAYYGAFKQFPANYGAKNSVEGASTFYDVKAVFGNDARYVSQYSRTSGYAQYVPYNSRDKVYYEFDIALDPSYWLDGERGVGRVVTWRGGWIGDGYDGSPVSVYTDDHYATFSEYLNDGRFGKRFDAERNLTFVKHSSPKTVN